MILYKQNNIYCFYYYYNTNQIINKRIHGLCNSYYDFGIGYFYHGGMKAFWLKK